jgi:hypothetical protein
MLVRFWALTTPTVMTVKMKAKNKIQLRNKGTP